MNEEAGRNSPWPLAIACLALAAGIFACLGVVWLVVEHRDMHEKVMEIKLALPKQP